MTKVAGVGGARRTRRSQEEWRSLVSRYQTSGLSIESFCRGAGISEASFYRWRTALSGNPGEGSGLAVETGSAFVDLGALEPVSTVKPKLDLRLELGDGLILHLVRH